MSSGIAAQPMAADEPEINLRDVLDVVRRRKWMIVLPFALVLGGAIGLSTATPPAYRASTTVTIDKSSPVILVDRAGDSSLLADHVATQAPDVSTLAELIRSDVVRDGAIARLARTLGEPAARAATAGLGVQPVRDTELVRITVEHAEPLVAADAANAVAASLVDMNLKARRHRATEIREFIAGQLANAGQRLRASEVDLVAYKNLHGDISLAQETTLTLEQLAELEAKRVEQRLPQVETATLVATLQSQLATLEIELSGLRRQFTAQHPAVLSTAAKIQETKRRLETELSRNRQTAQSRERAISAAIGQYEDKIRGVPSREAELARFTRSSKEAEQIYLLLSSKHQQALIAEASIGSVIQIVDAAKVPTAPATQRARKTLVVGAVLGLLVGLAGAFFKEQLDDTVRSADDVERVLEAPVMGVVPWSTWRPKAAGGRRNGVKPPLLAPLDQHTPLTEAYRDLRTHLLSSVVDDAHRCFLITSALPREGKSTVAVNLAFAFAHANRDVWLVDCDLRRPTLGAVFPNDNAPGLAMLLAGDAAIDTIVRPTAQPKLRFVASGPVTDDAAELLVTERLKPLIAEARTHADIVLLDSPPVLPAADAEVIGRHTDGALVVVDMTKTDRRALTQARQRLERAGVRILGAVLNFAPRGHQDDYHAYHAATRRRLAQARR